ncbi:MAG: DUF4442 domain-containing protein [Bacteroidota bacterium]
MALFSQRRMIRLINWYAPYFFSGIRMAYQSPDGLTYRVKLRQRFYNRNLFGTHFGGSLYAMCDPWFVFILLAGLGKGYIVWDKAATIRFRKPGKGTVTAEFSLTPEQIAEIKTQVDAGQKDFVFHAQVLNAAGEIVAEVEKTVYARPKGEKKN